MHYRDDCPDKNNGGFSLWLDDGDGSTGSILLTDNAINKSEELFLSESLGCGVIDCGCTETASGEIWFESHIERLSESQKQEVKILPCKKHYKFGDGEVVQALKRAVIPICLGNKKVSLTVDILPANIPLLLSKKSLQKGNAKIDFENNVLDILGEKLPLKDWEYLMISMMKVLIQCY